VCEHTVGAHVWDARGGLRVARCPFPRGVGASIIRDGNTVQWDASRPSFRLFDGQVLSRWDLRGTCVTLLPFSFRPPWCGRRVLSNCDPSLSTNVGLLCSADHAISHH
jgi:hypothetical protein